MVRQIALINELQERIDLLLKTSFLNDIAGFGYGEDLTFINTTNGFYTKTSQKTQQVYITGNLSFIEGSTAYADYRAFVEWVNNAEELTLAYRPYGDEEYYIDVVIESLTKGEKDVGGYLTCGISIRGLGAWYSLENYSFVFSEDAEGNEKRYSYRYSYRYGVSRTPGSVEFMIDGDYPGGLVLTLVGPGSAPIISMYVNDVLEGRIAFNGVSLNAGQRLHYSTVPNKIGVYMEENGEVTDLIDSVVMSGTYPTFFKIPPNKNIRLGINVDGAIQPGTNIQVLRYWKSR